MIKDIDIQVNNYFDNCSYKGIRPTKQGLAYHLGTTVKTLEHVDKGYYRPDKEYTDKPHTMRVVDNKDFEIIKGAYRKIENISI